ncbi:hypothetical protein ACWGI0_22115 [Streptomyces sp. NPDC054802]
MSETLEGGAASDRLTDVTDPVDPYKSHEPYEPYDLDRLDALDALDALDEQLIALVLHRARRARDGQLARRSSGLPMSPLARENAMLRRYAHHLGREGTTIALAVLALSRRH